MCGESHLGSFGFCRLVIPFGGAGAGTAGAVALILAHGGVCACSSSSASTSGSCPPPRPGSSRSALLKSPLLTYSCLFPPVKSSSACQAARRSRTFVKRGRFWKWAMISSDFRAGASGPTTRAPADGSRTGFPVRDPPHVDDYFTH